MTGAPSVSEDPLTRSLISVLPSDRREITALQFDRSRARKRPRIVVVMAERPRRAWCQNLNHDLNWGKAENAS
jgi:hypothetical protein